MKRNIISINEELCNGCGACVNGCHEGALKMIDGKARIISELYCDGLGACIGDCPVDAITIEEREAEPYNERAVMERISKKGEKTVLAHLQHLKDYNEIAYLKEGIEYIKEHNLPFDLSSLEDGEKKNSIKKDVMLEKKQEEPKMACGCPGSMARSFTSPASAMGYKPIATPAAEPAESISQLTHWPVQLHLLNPGAGFFNGADVLLAADCTAFAYANFHSQLLKGKKLAIACPKLDHNKEVYVDKLVEMIESSQINTLTVAIMEVPCCGGLMQIAQMAVQRATRKVPIKKIVVGVQGNLVSETWV